MRQSQTPKTPTAAAAFYFDDMLQHSKTSMVVKRLRRSSTARSMGGPLLVAPSSRPHVPFIIGSESLGSGASDADGEDEGEDEEERARRASMMRRKNSVGGWSEEMRRSMAAVDEKVAAFGAGRLEAAERGEVLGAEDEIATVGGGDGGAGGYFDVPKRKADWSWHAS
jgi:hypothetical protein